eukprot:comp22950_c0_seq1/m.58107 comp22950_c0_seq1/g.58107  ORF comp22950_c0_seq1/g.58107 comp22950_c0_seq1/m.58107 type:complete len:756 (+) comp22950_c0_seq1:243-2510(+)
MHETGEHCREHSGVRGHLVEIHRVEHLLRTIGLVGAEAPFDQCRECEWSWCHFLLAHAREKLEGAVNLARGTCALDQENKCRCIRADVVARILVACHARQHIDSSIEIALRDRSGDRGVVAHHIRGHTALLHGLHDLKRALAAGGLDQRAVHRSPRRGQRGNKCIGARKISGLGACVDNQRRHRRVERELFLFHVLLDLKGSRNVALARTCREKLRACLGLDPAGLGQRKGILDLQRTGKRLHCRRVELRRGSESVLGHVLEERHCAVELAAAAQAIKQDCVGFLVPDDALGLRLFGKDLEGLLQLIGLRCCAQDNVEERHGGRRGAHRLQHREGGVDLVCLAVALDEPGEHLFVGLHAGLEEQSEELGGAVKVAALDRCIDEGAEDDHVGLDSCRICLGGGLHFLEERECLFAAICLAEQIDHCRVRDGVHLDVSVAHRVESALGEIELLCLCASGDVDVVVECIGHDSRVLHVVKERSGRADEIGSKGALDQEVVGEHVRRDALALEGIKDLKGLLDVAGLDGGLEQDIEGAHIGQDAVALHFGDHLKALCEVAALAAAIDVCVVVVQTSDGIGVFCAQLVDELLGLLEAALFRCAFDDSRVGHFAELEPVCAHFLEQLKRLFDMGDIFRRREPADERAVCDLVDLDVLGLHLVMQHHRAVHHVLLCEAREQRNVAELVQLNVLGNHAVEGLERKRDAAALDKRAQRRIVHKDVWQDLVFLHVVENLDDFGRLVLSCRRADECGEHAAGDLAA